MAGATENQQVICKMTSASRSKTPPRRGPTWLLPNLLNNNNKSNTNNKADCFATTDQIHATERSTTLTDTMHSSSRHDNHSDSNKQHDSYNDGDYEPYTGPDGEVIPEMTEEEEQEIYELPQNRGTSSRSSSPPIRRNLLQRISSIRKGKGSTFLGSTSDHQSGGGGGGVGNNYTNHSSSGRLQSSYAQLEKEYCKLKFEQTELVALADQRKMEKQRSSELMETLEQDLNARRQENAKLRYDKEQLMEKLEGFPRVFGSLEEEHASNHELNTLWLRRDLAQHRLDEAQDELRDLRLESKQLIEMLQVKPIIPPEEVKLEHYRIKKTKRVTEMEAYVKELKADISRLHRAKAHNSGGDNHVLTLIGKEILVDDSNTQDTVSVTSTNNW
jgi:hypothetical protein